MKNRGFTDEEIQRDIDDYHAIVNNPEYLKETPNLKELLPINCFVRKPVDTSGIINEVGYLRPR